MVSCHRLTRRLSAPIVFITSQVFHSCGYLTEPSRLDNFSEDMHNPSQDTHVSSLPDAQPPLRYVNVKVVEKTFHFRTPTVHTTTTQSPPPTHFSLLNIKDQESRACSPGDNLISCKDQVE